MKWIAEWWSGLSGYMQAYWVVAFYAGSLLVVWGS